MIRHGWRSPPASRLWSLLPRAGVTLALAVAGCGGSGPTGPSSPVAIVLPPAPLTAGAYSLMLATAASPSGFSTCISIWISIGGSGAEPLQAPMGITVPAVVELTPAGWSGRSTEGTLVFTLWQSANGELAGAMSGVGKSESGGLSVVVGETDGSSASLVGRQTSGVNADGDVVGRLAFQSSTSSLSCNGNTWSLVRR